MKTYLVLGALLLFSGWLVWKAIDAGRPPKIIHPEYTVGTLTNLKQGQKSSGLEAVIIFHVDNKVYEKRIGSSKYKANILGEKYMIVYEEKNPSKNFVLTYQPIFRQSELTKRCTGTITRIYWFSWSNNEYRPNHGIEFEYVINGKKFKKAQSLPKNYKEKYKNIKEGASYDVEYWKKNPKRAIINLNKSTK